MSLDPRSRKSLPFAAAILAGVLQVLVFPQAALAWLAPVCLVPLLTVLHAATSRQRFLLGWASGVAFWAGACYWIYPVMRDYAGIAPPVAALLFVAFAIVKGLHAGVFAALAGPLLKRPWAVPAVAALWVAIEGSHQYLGFTWTQLGNAAPDFVIPQIIRLAPWTGVYGPSFVFALINAAIALAIIMRRLKPLLYLAAVLLVALLPGLPKTSTVSEKARLVQPNVHPDELKSGTWNATRGTEHLARMLELSTNYSSDEKPTLLVWPEYPVPAFYFDDPNSRAFIERVAREADAHFIFNTIGFEQGNTRRPQNSSATIAPDGELLSRYSKMHLVPFGEFVPWPFSYFVEKITMQAGTFQPGREVSVADVAGHGVGTFICYESVFARAIRKFPARGAEVLVNISNDSWYGRSAARYQHLLIARMRAIENGRWILRATNDGITTAIDPAGRLADPLPSYEQGVLTVGFNYESERTGYVRWGEWFWWLTIAIAGAAALESRWRP
jgi:apolipoprotein N-acyltransferase